MSTQGESPELESEESANRRAKSAREAIKSRMTEAWEFRSKGDEEQTFAEAWLQRWEKRTHATIEKCVGPEEAANFQRNMPNWGNELPHSSVERVVAQWCGGALIPLMEELQSHPEDVFAREDKAREAEARRVTATMRSGGLSRPEIEEKLDRLAHSQAEATWTIVRWMIVLAAFVLSLEVAPLVVAGWRSDFEPWAWLLAFPVSVASYFGLKPFHGSIQRKIERHFFDATK